MEHIFSEGFDAKEFYLEKMSEGWSFTSDEDPYGWDDLGQPQDFPERQSQNYLNVYDLIKKPL